ncbi:MAG: UvrD-helicase domain-containing protein [Anaerolineae bacterium]|nr:UvrD-helicase domain-containing protein [Anaerolineae bacterium]
MGKQFKRQWGKLAALLNRRQYEAVTAPQGPLLVIAGPGSGKTRIVTFRVAYLILQNHVPPDHILAVTFTNRAAEEMRSRLEHLVEARCEDVQVHTLHATALRFLREYGETIDLPADFVVADEEMQSLAIREAARLLNLSLELYPEHALQDYISRKKAAMQDPTILPARGEVNAVYSDVAGVYQEWLRDHHALDFDDLIYYAVQLLARRPDVRHEVQARLNHILVDEYQDINLAQYRLLALLAPPGSDITVVADGDQAIYGWRGAEPSLIERFRRIYRPRVVALEESYRSTQTILYAAQRFIAKGRPFPWRDPKHPTYLRSVHSRGNPIYHYLLATTDQEQALVASLVRRLHDECGYRYGDIAILYRTHRLAEALEGYLAQRGIPVHRVQKAPFFQRPMVREIIRYLYLIRSLTAVPDADVVAALNFPRTLADELTIMQLERLARRHGIGLTELARRSDRFPELSPLTRANLRAFLDLFESDLRPLADEPIEVIVERVLDTLAARRSPFDSGEMQLLRGWADFVARPKAVTQIRDWIDHNLPLVIHAPATIDGACAAAVLKRALEAYLAHRVSVVLDLSAEARRIEISTGGSQPLVIHVPPQRAVSSALAAVAWRLAQDVLATYERLADGRFVVYDLETTGTNPRRDEILEIGAQVIEHQRDAGPPFFSRVRPKRGSIPAAATAVHGITWADVEDAEPIEHVLPRFLAYVGEATVVGHNILAFDNRFIDRDASRLLGRPFRNPALDTLVLAQRLLPGEPSYSLEHLLRRLNLAERVEHRAAADVQQTRDLFLTLLEESRKRTALGALSELLPLVGLGMLGAEVALEDENMALWHGALRVYHHNHDHTAFLEDELVAQLPSLEQARARRLWEQMEQSTPPPLAEDEAWMILRDAFMDQVRTFARFSKDLSLGAFLDYQALVTSLGTEGTGAPEDRVTMMTMHNAKGTEFSVVIIIGVEEENLPLWTTLDDEDALEEERRVFYVGMTRAKERLYLCSVRDRGDGFVRTPSRFAFDLPAEYVRRVRVGPHGRVEELSPPTSSRLRP